MILIYEQTTNNMGSVSAALQATTVNPDGPRNAWVLGDVTPGDGLIGEYIMIDEYFMTGDCVLIREYIMFLSASI